jgi:Spy/CpxP family protein refolding chaperone
MKKLIRIATLAAAMCLAVTTVSQAQDAGQQQGRRGGGRGGIGMLMQGITVDSATMAKITEISRTFGAQQRELMQGGQPDMEKVREIQTKRNEEIKALLNDDQKKVFDENAAKAPQGRRGGPPPTL